MKNIEEIRLEAALTCIQGILEAKGGIIGEVDPDIAVKEAFRIADAFVKHYQEKYVQPKANEEAEKLSKIAQAWSKDWTSVTVNAEGLTYTINNPDREKNKDNII